MHVAHAWMDQMQIKKFSGLKTSLKYSIPHLHKIVKKENYLQSSPIVGDLPPDYD